MDILVRECKRKIKFFSGESKESVERDVNNFVNESPSKSIFDIKMDTTIHKSGMCIFTVMVEYEEYT